MMHVAVGSYIGDKILENLVDLYQLLSSDLQLKAIQGKKVEVHEISVTRDLGS